jgi:hypothetical protein
MASMSTRIEEECAGIGELSRGGDLSHRVRYRFNRSQPTAANGMPIPGLQRVQGHVDFTPHSIPPELIGVRVMLRLDDGRALGVVVTGPDGRIENEVSHHRGCSCC